MASSYPGRIIQPALLRTPLERALLEVYAREKPLLIDPPHSLAGAPPPTHVATLQTAVRLFGEGTTVHHKALSLFEEITGSIVRVAEDKTKASANPVLAAEELSGQYRALLTCITLAALEKWGTDISKKDTKQVANLGKLLSLIGAGIGAAPFGAAAGLIASALSLLAEASDNAQPKNAPIDDLVKRTRARTKYSTDADKKALNEFFIEATDALAVDSYEDQVVK